MTMLKVQVTRTFNSHAAGDVLLVEETDEVKQLVKGRYFEVLAIETDEPVEPAPAKEKSKPKGKAKRKAAKGKAAKDV